MGKDLRITNVAENIVGNLILNGFKLAVYNARGKSFKEFLHTVKKFTRNVLIVQPPINYSHDKQDKHGDFSLYHNSTSYFIEVKRADDKNSINEYAVYCSHTNCDRNMIVLVGDKPIQFNRNVKEFAKHNIELLTLDGFKRFLSTLKD
jgi:hypothetical protein